MTDLIGRIDVLLAEGEPDPAPYPRCRWCGHDWHGVACVRELGWGGPPCRCDPTDAPRDDTWRPSFVPWLARVAAAHGIDGWAALGLRDLPALRLRRVFAGAQAAYAQFAAAAQRNAEAFRSAIANMSQVMSAWRPWHVQRPEPPHAVRLDRARTRRVATEMRRVRRRADRRRRRTTGGRT